MNETRGEYWPTLDELIENGPRWDMNPQFSFANEIEAHRTLQVLGEDLDSARRQVKEVMRYLAAAVKAAADTVEDDKPISRQGIINNSGLSRRTVYTILDGQD